MIGNFYYEFSFPAVVIGVVLALGWAMALGLTRRPVLSVIGSALGWGLIAAGVWACGQGDIVGLFYLVILVPLAALVGGLAGWFTASLMRDAKRR